MKPVNIGGSAYLAGTALLLVIGVADQTPLQIIASVIFFVSSAVYAAGHYVRGAIISLVGLSFFLPTLPWESPVTWVTGSLMVASRFISTLEYQVDWSVRPVAGFLILLSRGPMMVATWGTPLMAVTILWLLGDIILGISPKRS